MEHGILENSCKDMIGFFFITFYHLLVSLAKQN